MQSPWEVDQRNNRYDVAQNYKGFERSTSAPPPETSLLFGSRNDRNRNGNAGVDVSFGGIDCVFKDCVYPTLSHLIKYYYPLYFVLVGIKF